MVNNSEKNRVLPSYHVCLLLLFCIHGSSGSSSTILTTKRTTHHGKYPLNHPRKPLVIGSSPTHQSRHNRIAIPRGGSNNAQKEKDASFAKWYMSQMEEHELRTKCISAGILALLGDVCAQQLDNYLSYKSSDHNNNGHATSTATGWGGIMLDKRRMMAMFCDGFLCTGPLLHFVYEFYERIVPIHEIKDDMTKQEKSLATKKRLMAAFLHVSFDNIFMSVFYVFAMMVVTALLEGRYQHISYELKHDFIPAVKASWIASLLGLAPMQLLSFHFLPMELRVLAVNFQDVIWVMVMSFVTHRNRH